ncbi:unnamed protein product [Closterium sp. NIES-54]
MPRAQRESGHKVKVICTDNGGEFIGADFEAVLKKKGIQHQLTVPYNPQQNGVAERFNRTLQEGARTLLGRVGLPDPFWVTALRQVALVKNRVLATVGDKLWVPYTKWYVKFLVSLYYKEWKQQQQKLPTTPLIIEADEVHRPSRQVQVTVSDEEISGLTGDGGEPEVEEQQRQQQDAPPCTQRPPDHPRRDVRPPNRLTYPSFGKPKVVRVGSVAEQCDEDEIAHCYWAAVPEPKMLAKALIGPDAEKWKQSVKEEHDSLLENETWELCELPHGKKAISSKLIFKHNAASDGVARNDGDDDHSTTHPEATNAARSQHCVTILVATGESALPSPMPLKPQRPPCFDPSQRGGPTVQAWLFTMNVFFDANYVSEDSAKIRYAVSLLRGPAMGGASSSRSWWTTRLNRHGKDKPDPGRRRISWRCPNIARGTRGAHVCAHDLSQSRLRLRRVRGSALDASSVPSKTTPAGSWRCASRWAICMSASASTATSAA